MMSINKIIFLWGILFILPLAGCKKNTTPNRVSRLIKKGTWEITSLLLANEDRTSDFEGVKFRFEEDGGIVVEGDNTVTGNWAAGAEKDPAILQWTVSPIGIYIPLNADWSVTSATRKQMVLELREATHTNTMMLTNTTL